MRIASTQFTMATESFEIYISGCKGNCQGCSNPEIKDFNVGEILNQEKINSIIEKINQFPNMIKHIWILGGDPLDNDITALKKLLKSLRVTNKKIWLWTRYEIEEIPEDVLELCEYVKCGAYKQELTCEDNIQEGIKLATSNQNIYKLEKPKSPILLDNYKVILNPDSIKVKEVRLALKANDGYCPCMFEKNEDTKCPCRTMRENQECHCGLFVKVKKGE
jgi:anaerobic ribonucleoside-triphosphate reductase activating protein